MYKKYCLIASYTTATIMKVLTVTLLVCAVANIQPGEAQFPCKCIMPVCKNNIFLVLMIQYYDFLLCL